MTLLIYAGLLYLLGISILLTFKPELMFSKNGDWKEFGLGRNREKYTWMPFWLFAILWAIMSYMIILVIASNTGLGGVSNYSDVAVYNESIEPKNVSMKSLSTVPPSISNKKPTTSDDLKSGYYILDMNETSKRGIPKYVYLGEESPNLIYRSDM